VTPAIRARDGARGEADRIRAMSPHEAATAVEGIFVSMLVSEMKKTLDGGGFFGDAPGSAVFDGMFDRMMGEELARRGGFGLGKFVEATLKAQQGAGQAPAPKTDLGGTTPS
jgi:Rod binding domain-containing protein